MTDGEADKASPRFLTEKMEGTKALIEKELPDFQSFLNKSLDK